MHTYCNVDGQSIAKQRSINTGTSIVACVITCLLSRCLAMFWPSRVPDFISRFMGYTPGGITINDNTLNVTVLQCTYNLVITLKIFTINHDTLILTVSTCFIDMLLVQIRCLVCELLAASIIHSSRTETVTAFTSHLELAESYFELNWPRTLLNWKLFSFGTRYITHSPTTQKTFHAPAIKTCAPIIA
jgi:hypothetical protein